MPHRCTGHWYRPRCGSDTCPTIIKLDDYLLSSSPPSISWSRWVGLGCLYQNVHGWYSVILDNDGCEEWHKYLYIHMYMHTVELQRLSIAEYSCVCDLIVNLTLLLCGTTAANQIHAVLMYAWCVLVILCMNGLISLLCFSLSVCQLPSIKSV